MYIIDIFTAETTNVKSTWTKQMFFFHQFYPLDQNPKIQIFHMVTSEHPEAIESRQRQISMGVIESEEASEDGYIDNDVLINMKSMRVVQQRRI